VRACQKSQPSRINFERLINGKFHGKIGGGFTVLFVERIGKEFFGFNHSSVFVPAAGRYNPQTNKNCKDWN
jgi:hypothetical protein